jgi:small GTP-binding protein
MAAFGDPTKTAPVKLKVLTIGNSSVGKTCLLMRFSDQGFNGAYLTTVGIDYKKKTVEFNGRQYTMCLWDTAGQERFHTITFAYFRGCHGMLLVYDITNQESFDRISYWVKKIKEFTNKGNESKKMHPQIVLVGNKTDLNDQRVIPYEQGKAKADEFGMEFVETSAKSNANVGDAFMLVLQKIVESGVVEEMANGGAGGGVNKGGLELGEAKRKKGCC